MNFEEEINYKKVYDKISEFKSETLRVKILEYYVRECKRRFKGDNGSLKNFSSHFYEYISVINTPQIEYYIEYCLLFYEKYFYKCLAAVYTLCNNFNMILEDMCEFFNRFYVLKKYEKEFDVEEKINDIIVPKVTKAEVQQLIKYIIEEEKEIVLFCYELAVDGVDFCNVCVSDCYQKRIKMSNKIKQD